MSEGKSEDLQWVVTANSLRLDVGTEAMTVLMTDANVGSLLDFATELYTACVSYRRSRTYKESTS